MKIVNKNEFETEVLKSDKLVIVDFFADWCVPCKRLIPILEELSKEREDIKVVKLNIDNDPEIAAKYGVRSIPTMIYFFNGSEKDRAVGVVGKDAIIKAIAKATK